MAKRFTVSVLFKNGKSIEYTCHDCSLTKQGSEIISLSFVRARPKPLFIDIDEVVAVSSFALREQT